MEQCPYLFFFGHCSRHVLLILDLCQKTHFKIMKMIILGKYADLVELKDPRDLIIVQNAKIVSLIWIITVCGQQIALDFTTENTLI